jgi:hypothetical protein
MLPIGSKILAVQKQKEDICLWVLQPVAVEGTEARTIKQVGTGEAFDLKENFEYIGTIQEWGGSLIWHFIEIK